MELAQKEGPKMAQIGNKLVRNWKKNSYQRRKKLAPESTQNCLQAEKDAARNQPYLRQKKTQN